MPGESESTTRKQRVDQLLARDRWRAVRSRPGVPGDHTAAGTAKEFPAGDLIFTCNLRDKPPTRREIKRFHAPGTRRQTLAATATSAGKRRTMIAPIERGPTGQT